VSGTARRPVVVLLGVLLASACHDAPPPPTRATLGGDVVARAGEAAVPGDVVLAVARAQGRSADAALEALVDDAVAAERARSLGLEAAWRGRLRAALAGLVVERVRAEASAKGDPTDDEVAALTRRYWRELDVGPTLRVVHAVVMPAAKAPPRRPQARPASWPTASPRAVASARDADDFEARAKGVPVPAGLEVRVERLPAFAEEDGRVVEGDGGMDATFVRAAAGLSGPGALSSPVETRFGWHVIRLVERLPARRPSLDERRRLLADEVRSRRAADATKAVLAARRAAAKVERSGAVDAILAELDRAPPAP
jgi:hypothetical protein